MMAGADEPATLSGFCQPMAMAMAKKFENVNPASRRPSRARRLLRLRDEIHRRIFLLFCRMACLCVGVYLGRLCRMSKGGSSGGGKVKVEAEFAALLGETTTTNERQRPRRTGTHLAWPLRGERA